MLSALIKRFFTNKVHFFDMKEEKEYSLYHELHKYDGRLSAFRPF